MAFVPKSMRHSTFKNVRCVSTEDIYKRVGPRNISFTGSSVGGSDYSDAINYNQSKLDAMRSLQQEDYNNYVNEQNEIERRKSLDSQANADTDAQ